MKLTAFLGSPRIKGNTDTLASRILDGAGDAGVETQAIELRKLKILPCVGCEKCWQKGTPCVQQDDMARVYDAIAASDVLLFATPVYWYGPTTYMKAMIDRLVPLNRPEGRPLIEGKSAILAVAYEEEGPEAAEPLIRMFELSLKYLEVELIGRIIVDGVGPKGAILGKPAALQQAYDTGKALGSSMR